MQVTLKLYARLMEYLPEDARNYQIKLDVSDKETAYSLLERYQVPQELAHLVLLNGVYMQPEERDKNIFKEGDTLAVWPPVAGG